MAAPAHVGTRTVEEVMLRAPKVWGPATTVAEARAAFDDDHLHALLIVDRRVLLAVLERPDLHDRDPTSPAIAAGHLDGRMIGPDADVDATRRRMLTAHRRRLAVVDDTRFVVGLLCLKRSGLGFCSAADVAARSTHR